MFQIRSQTPESPNILHGFGAFLRHKEEFHFMLKLLAQAFASTGTLETSVIASTCTRYRTLPGLTLDNRVLNQEWLGNLRYIDVYRCIATFSGWVFNHPIPAFAFWNQAITEEDLSGLSEDMANVAIKCRKWVLSNAGNRWSCGFVGVGHLFPPPNCKKKNTSNLPQFFLQNAFKIFRNDYTHCIFVDMLACHHE